MRMRHIDVRALPGCAVFSPHYLINGTIFEKRKFIGYKMCALIFSTTRLKHFPFQEELSEILSKMYVGLRVKYRLLLSYFNET
jgi:hypothetical protein